MTGKEQTAVFPWRFYLLVALLQLDRALKLKDQLVGQKTIPLPGDATLGFDNW